jgi:DNA polymerase III alpha subunit
MEFEAFGFYLKNHPLDVIRPELESKGITFLCDIEENVNDNSLIRMAGVLISTSVKSSDRGRYAYLTISDPTGLADLSIFNGDMITQHKNLIDEKMHNHLVFECSVRRDDAGLRMSVRDLWPLDEYLRTTKTGIRKVRQMRTSSEFSQKNRENYGKKGLSPKAKTQEAFPARKNGFIEKLNIHIFDESCVEDLFSIVSQTRASNGGEYTDINIIADGEMIELPKEFRITESEIGKIREIYGVDGLEIL